MPRLYLISISTNFGRLIPETRRADGVPRLNQWALTPPADRLSSDSDLFFV